MEIAPNIHLIPALVGTRPLQLFLLIGDERTLLLDTGCAPDPNTYIFPYIKKLGMTPADIDLALITHCDVDHCGGNSALKRANPVMRSRQTPPAACSLVRLPPPGLASP